MSMRPSNYHLRLSVKERPLPKTGKTASVATQVESARAVLNEAHAAASAAFVSYMQSLGGPSAGQAIETYGSCTVVAYDLSVPLRNVLRVLGVLRPAKDGGWIISDFEKHVQSNSSVAYQTVCDAARVILTKRFPDEGTFIVKTDAR
jgi:hypothetical protein